MSNDRPITSQTNTVRPPAPAATAGASREPGPLSPAFRADRLTVDVPGPDIMVAPELSMGELLRARDWKAGADEVSGSQINVKITKAYGVLDRQMTAYLGGPQRANWASFGKFASRSAGEQIVRLEAIERATRAEVGSVTSLLVDAVSDPGRSFDQAKALFGGKADPRTFLDNARKLREALVRGNTGIMLDIGPAYQAFLKAEAQGKDGLRALREAGYGQAPKDPQSFVMMAFSRYREVHRMGDEIRVRCAKLGIRDVEAVQGDFLADQLTIHTKRMTGDKLTPREELLKLIYDRDDVLLQANMYLGMQEQFLTLQSPEVFGNRQMEALMQRVSSGMAIQDATGVTPLLDEGGNWANFFDRMGLDIVDDAKATDKRVAPGVIELHVDGKNLKLAPNGRTGTIASYFSHATYAREYTREGRMAARRLLERDPDPLPAIYTRNPFNRFHRNPPGDG